MQKYNEYANEYFKEFFKEFIPLKNLILKEKF